MGRSAARGLSLLPANSNFMRGTQWTELLATDFEYNLLPAAQAVEWTLVQTVHGQMWLENTIDSPGPSISCA
jgi:hypothetical protein